MFTPKKITLAVLSVCLTPSFATATELQPINVTATAEEAQQTTTETKKLTNTSNSETGTTLRQISGVDAARMGGHGVDLVIRGQKESQLNILIDGAKIEGGCPNRMDPPTAYAEMSSFDEVTVIKGVNSVTYGVGGSGGTVLLERNAPTFEEGKSYNGEINMGTSNNGVKQDINATVSAGGDKGYIVLQGAKKSAENYIDGNGEEIRSSYDSQQGHIDLGWTPNEDHELRLSYENTLTEDALFEGAAMDSPMSDGTTVRLSYDGANIAKNIQAVEVDIYHSDVDHVMDNYTLRTPPGDNMRNVTDVQTRGAKVKASSMFGHTQLDYGIQLEGVDKMSTLYNDTAGVSAYFMWPDVEATTKSIFAESTSMFKDNQKVILGLRYDHYDAKANAANQDAHSGGMVNLATNTYTAAYQNYSGKTSTNQSGLNILMRYERDYANNLNIFAGLSRTHRYADATELFMAKGPGTNATDWIGNPDLDPEQHNQLDMGISQNGKNSSWSVSAYYDKVHNYILRDKASNQDSTNGGGNIYLNKDATIYGIEASADWKVANNIVMATNLNFSKGTNETDNRNLSNISPVSGNVSTVYTASNWDSGARFNFAAEQTEVNVDYGELETAGWSTVDLFANYQINKSVKLSAGVDNLFDHAYENYLNRVDSNSGGSFKVYEPGRTVWAKLNAQF